VRAAGKTAAVTTLQKLLTPTTSAAIPERGAFTVGGPVARAADLLDLSPSDLVACHGWDRPDGPWRGQAPPYVDVLRFDVAPLMGLTTPVAPPEPRPWATYDLGWLRGPATAPVWMLQRTRVPIGAEFWRLGADGKQTRLSHYGGPALGWFNAQAYRAPLMLAGPRAVWRGTEVPCALLTDGSGVELAWVADAAPAGFETVRPGVHRRTVSLAECEAVFEVDVRARWRDADVRVVQVSDGGQAQVDLVDPDPDAVRRLGAVSLEPGLFEAIAPRSELVAGESHRRELPGVGG
jgi:hypothetical protein